MWWSGSCACICLYFCDHLQILCLYLSIFLRSPVDPVPVFVYIYAITCGSCACICLYFCDHLRILCLYLSIFLRSPADPVPVFVYISAITYGSYACICLYLCDHLWILCLYLSIFLRSPVDVASRAVADAHLLSGAGAARAGRHDAHREDVPQVRHPPTRGLRGRGARGTAQPRSETEATRHRHQGWALVVGCCVGRSASKSTFKYRTMAETAGAGLV